MKVAVAGAGGAFGVKHLNALKNINGVEVVSVVGRTTESIAVSYTHLRAHET